VIVTDALDMVGASGEVGIPEAAVRAVAAGCDLLCIGTENTDDELTAIEAALADAVRVGRLDPVRLSDAVGRVGRLAREMADDRARIPVAEYAPVPAFSLDRTIAVFDTTGFDLGGSRIAARRIIVVLETAANIAVGATPWGVAAAGTEVLVLREGDSLDLSAGTQPVIVGTANHRRPWVRSLIDDTRRRHPSTVVVDLGWPGDDRRYADVAAFGASRHAGLALLQWLESQVDS
jgi:beta-N-acetylhexosaminidase